MSIKMRNINKDIELNQDVNQELNKHESATHTIKQLILIFAVFLLFALTVLIFLKTDFLNYLIGFGEPRNLNATIINLPQLKNSSFGSVQQFYPNMKFNHNNLSYLIHSECPNDKKESMIEAFNLILQDTGIINFTSVSENEFADKGESDSSPVSSNPNDYQGFADIEILCSPEEKASSIQESDFFIAGEGGAKEIIQTGRYNVITRGVILLYGNPQNAIHCNWPNTEVHELVHVFGFNHSYNKESLMYPYLSSCDQKLDDSIINELVRLYSQPNLPDFYFENVSAVKKGRYLDFNITIRNSGDVKATNISYSIVDNGKVIDTNELENLNYGAGIVLEVNNVKLLNRDSKDIKIVIDYYNHIPEIDKANNVARLSF